MPPLYGEIVKEIPMTHTQWGTLWGITFLPMMVFTLLGGMYADRLGTKWIVGLATIAMGICGIGRAYAQEFNHLLFLMLFLGIGSSFLMPNLPKSLAHWFPSNELGLANGLLTVGICVGSGSALLISGVYLAPLMGGWRNVMWVYGVICIVLGTLWLLVYREHHSSQYGQVNEKFSFRTSLSTVIRVKDLWLLMLSRFCIVGVLIAVIGFLPELLASKGMKQSLADLSSSLIYYVNIIGVIGVPLLSDKLGLRKIFIWPCALLGALLVITLGFFQGSTCLVICSLLGLLVGFIPLMNTIPIEMDGIELRYAGTALGLLLTVGNLGSFIAPLLGGILIDETGREGTAFVFWGILMALGALFILPMKETGTKMMRVHKEEEGR
jgi:MFS family permease